MNFDCSQQCVYKRKRERDRETDTFIFNSSNMSLLDFGYGSDAGAPSYANLGIMGTDQVSWIFEEDKIFDTGFASIDGAWSLMGDDYWGALQKELPQKHTTSEIKKRFNKFEEDARVLDSGILPLPSFEEDEAEHHATQDFTVTAEVSFGIEEPKKAPQVAEPAPAQVKKQEMPPPAPVAAALPMATKKSSSKIPAGKAGETSERRKGVPWTEEEHRLFLLGLAKFGKGDWRSISRNFVVSRTPTQVASHAQKYFIRLNSMNKKDNKRRSSIHDITSPTAKA